MRSIERYLLVRLLGGAAVVLAVAGAVVYLVASRAIERQFDASLQDRAQSFASMLFQVEDEVEFEFSGELMPEFERVERPSYFHLRFADGEQLERSETLGERDLDPPLPIGSEPTVWTAPLPDGRAGRFVGQRMEIHHVYPEEGPGRPVARHVDVIVARGVEPLVAARTRLLVTCAGVALALLALLGGLAWRSVQRGLAPVARLAAALDRVRVEELPERLEAGALPAELRPVAETTDALLGRIRTAFERERRTTADIAHELRTPISEVLTVSEVALRGDHALNGSREALETVRDTAGRMARAVATLLKLSRLEMGAEQSRGEELDLAEFVGTLRRSQATLERERRVKVGLDVEEPAFAVVDPQVASIVASNLLANAVYHSPVGGVVVVTVRGGDDWSLTFANDAPDLDARDVERLCEPFWRKDRSRSDRSRSGLGLALSRALVDAAGLSLTFALADGRFVARLGAGGGSAREDVAERAFEQG